MKRRPRTKKPAAAKRPGTKAAAKTTKTKAVAKKPIAARATKTVRTTTPRAPATPVHPARRVIFIDVENTSSENTLLRVLDHLAVDRTVQPTEVIAIGNWKSVGTKVARTLASLGAQLVHSAPAPGVRDWSDLWIAVTAGRWLALAAPGDRLDIVSDDRAFDAVHDAAASVGVVCNRISYRHLPGAPSVQAAPVVAAPEERAHRPRHRGGRGRGRGPAAQQRAPQASATAPPTRAVAPTAAEHAEAHAASQEQIRAVLARLTGDNSARWINLDLLSTALKAEGFSRPPGSPRLITRLRSIKGVEVNANGMLRLVGDADASSSAASPGDEGAAAAAPVRRPRRRGGRRHRRRPPGEEAGSAATPDETESSDPGAETS
jgi:hypothetical protein